jgi:hypothetical protein
MALRLYGDNVEQIDPELRSAWAAVSAVLTSKEVERAIRIKLSDGLEIRAHGDTVPSAAKGRSRLSGARRADVAVSISSHF